MIPIHVFSQVARSAVNREQARVGRNQQSAGRQTSCVAAQPQRLLAGRLTLAVTLALLLSGGIIAITWGGTGLFFKEPETSARPGINSLWMNSNVAELAAILETDSREMYRERAQIAGLLELKQGDDVADVGAGTGFLSEEIARRVGASGRVFAVEINPGLVQHIQARAESQGLSSLRAHLGEDRKMNIGRREGGNFDLVVLADTYQYLEFPKSMLLSIRRLMRNRGRLVILEAPRSAPALPDQVRLDKLELIREVSAEGFALVNEVPAPFLKDHYVLLFRKD